MEKRLKKEKTNYNIFECYSYITTKMVTKFFIGTLLKENLEHKIIICVVVVWSLSHSKSLQHHELQHTRLPCPSLTPGVCSNSCSLSWCYPTISSCHPLLLLPSIFPSIRVFSNELTLRIRWPKYWGSSFSINPNNEYSGLISFRIDWFDDLAVQGTLKSLLQHHNSKASAFFTVQLSHPYMTTRKTIALTVDLCQQSDVSAF